jgi:hypothetical protein
MSAQQALFGVPHAARARRRHAQPQSARAACGIPHVAAAAGAAEPRRLFTFGFGYTTLAVAHVAKEHGWCVASGWQQKLARS